MLIYFSVRNFKSFKDKATLSLIASNYDKETRENDNIIQVPGYDLRLLKSAVIYGANASGKSKLIDALAFMRRVVISSSKDSQKGDKISVEPFRLNIDTEKEASEFEVIFIHRKIMYRYGFEVNKNEIIAEWLYTKPKTKEVELFYRDYQDISTHATKFTKGNTIAKEGLVRSNALLLSTAAQFNDELATAVLEWFKTLKTLSGSKEESYQGFTLSQTKDSVNKDKILKLLNAADLGIEDIKLKKMDIDSIPEELPQELKEFLTKTINEEDSEIISDVTTSHKKYNNEKKYVENVTFSLGNDESDGTKKFFALTGPILDAIDNGHILIVDELDSKLHPNLVCKIVSLFNSKTINPKNAQLVFNTHDTNLLSSGLFRRDQVWFTKKNKYGEAKLYSLADFKSSEVRKNEAFEENYLRGKYDAIPYLNYFDELIALNLFGTDENEK